MVRQPAVAGQFYRGTTEGLTEQVSLYIHDLPRERVIGAVSPHAGLMYSGQVAGLVYSKIEFPDTFVLLGPNHTGLGNAVSLMSEGSWEIPTGLFEIDQSLAFKIYKFAQPIVSIDEKAHMFEHSLEVQLPFIAFFKKNVKIVPISIMHVSVDECELLGRAIAEAIRDTDYQVTIIASSDMSHYLPADRAREFDFMAIERILELDPKGLYNTVVAHRISMCGYLPVTTMLFASLELGAKKAELLKYSNSGDINGDYDQVVGYAGIIVK